MIQIPLQAIPNQSLSIALNGINFDLTVHSCNNTPSIPGTSFMTVSIVASGVLIVDNVRAVPATGLIGYQYLEQGDFFFITDNDEYPDYNLFNNNQALIYASQAELEAIVNGGA